MSTETTIARMLTARQVAVVGLSDDPRRASHGVAKYLVAHGYEIIPINPNCAEVMGLKSYPSLKDVPGEIDLVDIFRRPEYCPAIVREAIAIGANGVWLQLGIVSEESRQLAADAGIDFIQDRCLKIEHMNHKH